MCSAIYADPSNQCSLRGEAMGPASDFQKAYFLQTRQEIDTDKKIRDTTLNFAVLVLGATGFVVFRADNAEVFLKSWNGLALAVSAIIIITSLFYARREKMRQITDRWFVLHDLLKRNPEWLNSDATIEAIVTYGFSKHVHGMQRYITKDFILNTAFCSPLFIATVFFHPAVGAGVIGLFLAMICWLHLKKIPDPLGKIQSSEQSH